MISTSLTLMAWSYGFSALGYFLFAAYLGNLGYTYRDGFRSWALFIAVVCSALWGGSVFAFSLTGSAGFLMFSGLADTLRYCAWQIFILLILRPQLPPKAARWFTGGAIALALIGAALQCMKWFSVSIDGLQRFMLFHWLGVIVFSIVLLEQLFRNVVPDSRWSVKPLLLGLGGAFLFDLYLFSDALLFKALDADAFSVRGFAHAVIIPLLLLATTRSGFDLAKIRLSQRAAFHSTTLMFVGIYLLFMALVGYYVRFFGGEWGRAVQFAILFAALISLAAFLFSGAMRARLRVFVSKHFFRYRYDYREEWLRFTQALGAQNSLQAMGEQVIRGLADLVESPAGGLWLVDASKVRYSQIARWNMPVIVDEEKSDSSLSEFLRANGWVINLEEYRSYTSQYRGLKLPDWLSHTENAWLVVPLLADNDVIGFVVLAKARTAMDVNWEVTDLLKTAGRQAASFLAQVMLAEELIEARKFDAFNRMSAFVVHDLKNILTQLSLMLKNAERHGGNPEFQADMLMTVQNSVDRMRQLMVQLREGATPTGVQQVVSLEAIARRIQAARNALGRSVEVSVAEPVRTRCSEERLERVIGHVVQNALDATDSEGRVWMSVGKTDGRAIVVVGDNGHGMSSDFIKERLFRPFQTTKQAGMGIGAYESFQYIRELGGDIEVESEVGGGTTITMFFPLAETTNLGETT